MLSQGGEEPTRIVSLAQWLGGRPLFTRDTPVTNTWQVIGWWESRRPAYNLIVGGTGVFTCVVMLMLAAAAEIFFNSDFGLPDPPLFAIAGVIVYGVLANVCYTGGWIAELAVRKLWPDEADRFAKTTFSLGMIFSVFLTLVPAIVVWGVGFLKLAHRVLLIRRG